MDTKIKLVIADASTLLREGLKRLLHDGEDFLVVGEACNDVETLGLIEQVKPDVLILDRDIPKLGAVPILLAINEQKLATRVLILSLLPDESQILSSARAGARGYILKSTIFAVLAEAIGEVARGRIWVDRNTRCADTFALLAHKAQATDEIGAEINPLDVLTKRELQILNLIARGLINDDIAKKLAISPTTVKTHAHKIFDKLNVRNRTEAALVVMQARLRNSQDHSSNLLRSV
jgi:DNA-binding NarL/FixJ family response regulator